MPVNASSRTRNKRMRQYKNLLISTRGSAPINPFKGLRESCEFDVPTETIRTFKQLNRIDVISITKHDMTMQQIADNAGITKQALLRTEQGFYQNPPERLTSYFVRKFDVPYETLVDAYEYYQRATREYHGLLFGAFPSSDYPFNIKEHPFNTLKCHWSDPTGTVTFGTLNTTEVAKLLCLSQSVLSYWENKITQQASVPGEFCEALLHNGYSRTDLFYLKHAYTQYRNACLGKNYEADENSNILPPVGKDTVEALVKRTSVSKDRLLALVRESDG